MLNMFGILEAAAMPHAGVFNTYEDLMFELNKRMEREGYKIVKARSHRGKMGGADVPGNEIVRCDLVCNRGGRPYRCMATKHKTTTKKTDCPWKAKAVNRKTVGGWVLTISCDQHNHEPGTPEPPSPTEMSGADDEDIDIHTTDVEIGPHPDADTSAALQVAGVSDNALRLTGDTFQQLKADYRKMTQSERLAALAQLQLRLAAIYAVQNEDMQRQQRQDAQDRRHRGVEANRKMAAPQKQHPQTQSTNQASLSSVLPSQSPQSSIPRNAHSGSVDAPDALIHETHIQFAQSEGAVDDMDLSQFHHYPGPPKKARGHRIQGV